ncbi:LTA synthase family protein [Vibrio sagamiensis]|uniref:LTA synthase family protein n=1 Tax=Vibrio sagamiensis TaxID=512650 RepID=UPI001300C016|nr:alkaline phosphatase family protein [Vibrio sagamiensis]
MINSFLHGIRFDVAAILTINTPVILISFLLPFIFINQNSGLRWLQGIFWLFNVPFIIFSFVDLLYYPFTGKRNGLEVFDLWFDIKDQIGQLFTQYALISLVFTSALICIIRINRCKSSKHTITKSKYAILFLFTAVVVVLGIRGGLQTKPLKAYHALAWPSANSGDITLNSTLVLLKREKTNLNKKNWFATDELAYQAITPKVNTASTLIHKGPEKPNVVIIILESYSLEFVKDLPTHASYTPFLKSLTEKGLYFENGFANGRASIDAVPSIHWGIPKLMNSTFVRSEYVSDKLYGLPEIMQNHGYRSMFFHGAKNGSMFFDITAEQLGFDDYYGRTQYDKDNPNHIDFDGKWGIFDEPFLQYAAQVMGQTNQPFLSTIFTISNHNPFTLPNEYKETLAVDDPAMIRTVRYADIALQKFFATAEKMPWYDNTLFVITADHTGENVDSEFATKLGNHRIPLLLYTPNKTIGAFKSDKIVQQIDIPATVLDYVGLIHQEKDKLLPFGQSMLPFDTVGRALFFANNQHILLHGNSVTSMQVENDQINTEKLNEFLMQVQPDDTITPEELQKQLKAYIQIYNNGLVDNSFFK